MKPARVTKPGDVLKEELEARGWSVWEFADKCELYECTITGIIERDMPITHCTANRFAEVLGTTADFWLNMERDYRESGE